VWGALPAAGPFKRAAYPVRGAARPGRPFAYAEAVGALLHGLELERRLGEVRQPVLLACGSRDRLAPPAHSRRLAEVLPHAELLEVPGATHWSTLFAAALLQRLDAWIGERTGG
jgi:pimeloyl-ACP methyl ester carboxylesterase